MRLADYVINFLAEKGVKHIFMLPGGGAMHLDDALGRHPEMKYTVFMHEQALAIAAEAYGQHTNTPGVGLVTSGPGGTNTLTAVAAAYIDSTPCFFLSGQAKRSDLKYKYGVRQMGSQEVDIVSMVSPVTKYAVMVTEPEKIRYHLERAWYEAVSGRMGPVWLDIPLDVQGAQINEDFLEGFVPEDVKKNTEEKEYPFAEVKKLLAKAKRPLVLAGNGIKLSGGSEKVLSFIRKHSLPVLASWKMADFMAFEDPLFFGFPGIMGARYSNYIVQNCDLLLILGSRLDPSITAFNSSDFAANAVKIMVDIDENEIRKIENIPYSFCMDINSFMEKLEETPFRMEKQDPFWLPYCRKMKEKYPVYADLPEYGKAEERVDLYRFTDTLFEKLTPEDVIVPESSGAAGEVTYQGMKVKKGQKIKNAAGLGSMGFGLPYSIGACFANGKRRTILINGDGAFQMNIQELETIRRLALPIKMFIWDNEGYGSIVNTQNNMFDGFHVGSDAASGYTVPDMEKIACAYGLRTKRISCNKELSEGIEEVLAGEDACLCVVKVRLDHKTMPKVMAQKLPDGNMVSGKLENMWPFLPEEETMENMSCFKEERE